MPNDNGMYTIKILSNIGPFHSLVIDFFRIILSKTSYFIAENDSVIYFKHNSKKVAIHNLRLDIVPTSFQIQTKKSKGKPRHVIRNFLSSNSLGSSRNFIVGNDIRKQ